MISTRALLPSLGSALRALRSTPVRAGILMSLGLAAVACGTTVVDEEARGTTSGGAGGAATLGQETTTGTGSGTGASTTTSTATGYGGSVPNCDDSYQHVVACIPAQNGVCPSESQATQDALAAAVGLCSEGSTEDCCGQTAVYGLATCQPVLTSDGRCCYVADTETAECAAGTDETETGP